jgi:DNA-binding MarR family transcriptional regulator
MSKGVFGRLENELAARDKAAGLTIADLLSLPAPQRRLVQWLMRDGEANHAAVIAQVGQDEHAAQAMIDALVEQGYVRATTVNNERRYAARLQRRGARDLPLNIWTALSGKIAGAEGDQS